MERYQDRTYKQLSKSRSCDTRQIVLSRIDPTGRYKLAELVQMNEGTKRYNRFIKGGIEIENLELLAGLHDAIRIALQAEGYFDEDVEEIGDDVLQDIQDEFDISQLSQVLPVPEGYGKQEVIKTAIDAVSDMIDKVEDEIPGQMNITDTITELAEAGSKELSEEVVADELAEDEKLAIALEQGLITQDQYGVLMNTIMVDTVEEEVIEESETEGFADEWADDVPVDDWDA